MNILFIHQNFPGQFMHLATDLGRDSNHKVVALAIHKQPAPAGVSVRHYSLVRGAAADTHPLLRDQEAQVLCAEACAAAALQLKREGFVPDVIMAHPGWGEALFMKEVFPTARLVIYCEYYYAQEGQDVGFDPEMPALNFAQRCRLRLRNSTNLLSMEIADAAISPTQWQKSTYPLWAQEKITVIHDGIDTTPLRPDPKASLVLAATAQQAAVQVKAGDEVLTYVARNLEPVRGFHIFMRTLPEVLRQRPKARAIIVGGDDVSYGTPAPGGKSWREHMLAEVGAELDMRRVHFVGQLNYAAYLQVLKVSKVHAYWTVPFVLSWSFLEAALSGVPVVASDTAPVREYSHYKNIKTCDFFDIKKYERNINNLLTLKNSINIPKDMDEISKLSHINTRKKNILIKLVKR